jgi:hypothetical protein
MRSQSHFPKLFGGESRYGIPGMAQCPPDPEKRSSESSASTPAGLSLDAMQLPITCMVMTRGCLDGREAVMRSVPHERAGRRLVTAPSRPARRREGRVLPPCCCALTRTGTSEDTGVYPRSSVRRAPRRDGRRSNARDRRDVRRKRRTRAQAVYGRGHDPEASNRSRGNVSEM